MPERLLTPKEIAEWLGVSWDLYELGARSRPRSSSAVPFHVAVERVNRGLADRVSAAGHLRLTPGIRIEKIDSYPGAADSITTTGRRDWKQPHPRCKDWRRQV